MRRSQYITDDAGHKIAIVIPIKNYEKMMQDVEELACIKDYDKAKAKKQEFIPAADMFDMIEKKRKSKYVSGTDRETNTETIRKNS